MADQVFNSRRIRVLTTVDKFSRISPLIEVEFSHKAHDFVASLELVIRLYGRPDKIRFDNGP